MSILLISVAKYQYMFKPLPLHHPVSDHLASAEVPPADKLNWHNQI